VNQDFLKTRAGRIYRGRSYVDAVGAIVIAARRGAAELAGGSHPPHPDRSLKVRLCVGLLLVQLVDQVEGEPKVLQQRASGLHVT
jgi:hypothetical protein